MREGHVLERISGWLAGERTPGDEHHVAECEGCSAELARMEKILLGFRGAVRSLAAQQPGALEPESWRFESAQHARTVRRVRWSLVTAAITVAIALPAWNDRRDRQRAADADRADAALLERVSYQISHPVPAPLEPLQKMFANDASGGAQRDIDASWRATQGDKR